MYGNGTARPVPPQRVSTGPGPQGPFPNILPPPKKIGHRREDSGCKRPRLRLANPQRPALQSRDATSCGPYHKTVRETGRVEPQRHVPRGRICERCGPIGATYWAGSLSSMIQISALPDALLPDMTLGGRRTRASSHCAHSGTRPARGAGGGNQPLWREGGDRPSRGRGRKPKPAPWRRQPASLARGRRPALSVWGGNLPRQAARRPAMAALPVTSCGVATRHHGMIRLQQNHGTKLRANKTVYAGK